MRYRPDPGMLAGLAVILAVAVLVFLLVLLGRSYARPSPAWQAQRIQAEYGEDYETLRRMDYLSKAGTLRDATGAIYHVSCCGPADAYEADEWSVDELGNVIATLTCNTPHICEEIPGKVTRAAGSKWRIPPLKMLVNTDPVNITGHGWVWISPNSTDENGDPTVYCGTLGAGG